jgi:putative peptide zinc metalloprotease protein
VDSRNIANAAARCTDCRATAIAFQVVLAWGNDIGAVIPRNQAVAINDQCTRCVVYAGARQFVRLVDEPARFTDAGREVLADVRDKLRAIEYADLSVDEQIAIVEAQEARVLKVITEEVVPLAGEGSLMVEDRDDREADAD